MLVAQVRDTAKIFMQHRLLRAKVDRVLRVDLHSVIANVDLVVV